MRYLSRTGDYSLKRRSLAEVYQYTLVPREDMNEVPIHRQKDALLLPDIPVKPDLIYYPHHVVAIWISRKQDAPTGKFAENTSEDGYHGIEDDNKSNTSDSKCMAEVREKLKGDRVDITSDYHTLPGRCNSPNEPDAAHARGGGTTRPPFRLLVVLLIASSTAYGGRVDGSASSYAKYGESIASLPHETRRSSTGTKAVQVFKSRKRPSPAAVATAVLHCLALFGVRNSESICIAATATHCVDSDQAPHFTPKKPSAPAVTAQRLHSRYCNRSPKVIGFSSGMMLWSRFASVSKSSFYAYGPDPGFRSGINEGRAPSRLTSVGTLFLF
ncbi:hypothetical protein H4582DRAFT_2127484 [Lactarius indigo]|nr:hypothetical protein H4582DRAFT_2127484 [Lactarius indigo]